MKLIAEDIFAPEVKKALVGLGEVITLTVHVMRNHKALLIDCHFKHATKRHNMRL